MLSLIRFHCIFGSLCYSLCCTSCFRGFTLQLINPFPDNITIKFVPTKIFKYYISMFQHNSTIDILRLRTDARSFSDASHGGSTHTEDMHVRLSESFWEATISSKYFNWYVIDSANNKPYSYFVWHVFDMYAVLKEFDKRIIVLITNLVIN